MRRIIPAIVLVIAVGGCIKRPSTYHDKGQILKVDFKDASPSCTTYFDAVEVIPLESSDSSLMSDVWKAIGVDDTIFLFERTRYLLFAFKDNGDFISRIGKRGEGPEEYHTAYDFSRNPSTGHLTLLSPFGELVEYSSDNRFIGRKELTLDKTNYWGCEWMDKGRLALWSTVESDTPAVSVIDVASGKSLFDGWYHDRSTDALATHPLNVYDGILYFTPPLGNTVYTILPDSMKAAYTWDFGEYNISERDYENTLEGMEPQEIVKKITGDLEKGNLPYIFSHNWETSNYYIARLWSDMGGVRTYPTVIYDKQSGKGLKFQRFKEGISFRPLFVCDEYVLSEIPTEDVEALSMLTGTHINHSDDDNIILVRLRFKR